jgi:hypothetical protein
MPLDEKSISMTPSPYLHSPSWEYNLAFNMAMAGWETRAEPLRAVMSSEIHAVELLKRCQRPLHISGSGEFEAEQFFSQMRDWAWGPIQFLPLVSTGQHYSSFIWAEPEIESTEEVIRSLGRMAEPGAQLKVITSSLLHHFLPAWQTQPHPARKPSLPGSVTRLLRAAGWKISNQIVFHGPRSIFWSLFSRAAEQLGRPDWADRGLFAMRSSYREPGWLWPAAPLTLICASFTDRGNIP